MNKAIRVMWWYKYHKGYYLCFTWIASVLSSYIFTTDMQTARKYERRARFPQKCSADDLPRNVVGSWKSSKNREFRSAFLCMPDIWFSKSWSMPKMIPKSQDNFNLDLFGNVGGWKKITSHHAMHKLFSLNTIIHSIPRL